jgi:hypothetical protein
MSDAAIFAIVFAYSAVLWVVVLVIYSAFVESLDFGRLSMFGLKSVVLIGIVAAVNTFIPYGGLLTLIVWAIGLVIVFRMDLWEIRVLVLLLWGVNFVFGLLIRSLLVG